MSKYLLLFIFLSSYNCLFAQLQRATIHPDFTTSIEQLSHSTEVNFRHNNFEQLADFPKRQLANPTFKNVRNCTLADLNRDGLDDILFVADNQLFAYSATELLWQRDLGGTATYPPSVADIDKDGELEIVQAVFGGFEDGRLYVLEVDGTDANGFPLQFDNLIVTAPTLTDVDNNGLFEILVNEITGATGLVHLLNLDGTSFNENWPVHLAARPAVTPSVVDVDNDGEKEIVVFSTEARYILQLNGEPEIGFPQVTDPIVRYSFHSPLLVSFDNDDHFQIVGSSTGDAPEYFVLNPDATFRSGWPQPVPDNNWTFNPPTVVEMDNEHTIFMSRPISDTPKDMLYAWDKNGVMRDGFPIEKAGGLEGYISIADIDGDDKMELVFGSNLLDTDGFGFIHAYEMDGSGEVDGFPIRPRGWTFMNGVSLSDIDGDGMMDLTALTYTQTFGSGTDSVYLNSYNLNVPYSPERVLWNTYKGNNSRDGVVAPIINSSTISPDVINNLDLKITPNPLSEIGIIDFKLSKKSNVSIDVYDVNGKIVKSIFTGQLSSGQQSFEINIKDLESGMYSVIVKNAQTIIANQQIIKI